MRSFRHRLEKLERAIARARRTPGEILFDKFSTDVQSRMQRTGESLEQSIEAVTKNLTVEEIEIVIAQLEEYEASDSAHTRELQIRRRTE